MYNHVRSLHNYSIIKQDARTVKIVSYLVLRVKKKNEERAMIEFDFVVLLIYLLSCNSVQIILLILNQEIKLCSLTY